MSLSIGIVGLPNVGKSTLFNAITNTINAEVANYPFCTIEPNVKRISVPDERLKILSSIAGSEKIIPSYIDIVDIAGLVEGASKGEGLGIQFLSNIREVDAILHVVRCFEDENILHVANRINPIKDLEIIETELILADIDHLEKMLINMEKKKSKDNDKFISVGKKALEILSKGILAIDADFDDEEKINLKYFRLLTNKPVLYVANIDENSIQNDNKYVNELKNYLSLKNNNKSYFIIICSKIEMEMSILSESEKDEFLKSIGCNESGLTKLIKEGYKLLDLITFFTVGPKECHAWSLKNNYKAPQAAGIIHSDMENGFIRAQTISYIDYVNNKGEEGSKNNGKMRIEGKDYIVKDGDIFHFLFNN